MTPLLGLLQNCATWPTEKEMSGRVQVMAYIIDRTSSLNGQEYSSLIVLTLLERRECGSEGTPRGLQSSIWNLVSPFDVRFFVQMNDILLPVFHNFNADKTACWPQGHLEQVLMNCTMSYSLER